MIISGAKARTVEQQTLWDWVGNRTFKSMAETRNWCGDFYEEAGSLLLDAPRHTTDGSADVCPDLVTPGKRYVEVKSIGQNRQGLIYQQRMENDAKLQRETGRTLTYMFFIHNVRASECTDLFQLRSMLAAHLDRVLVIPFDALYAACRSITPRVMNYRTPGKVHKERIEMPGYRLSWRLLNELAGAPTGNVQPVLPYNNLLSPAPIHNAHPELLQ